MGSVSAPVVVIEFADFQCPFCGRAAENLREFRAAYAGEVAVVYRHFPLTAIHDHAMEAAIASECAAAQERFESFHDRLYQEQDSIGSKDWVAFAEEAGVPSIADFIRCLQEEWPRDRVRRDARAARQIRLTGTPSIIVNGVLLPGTPSVEELEEQLRLVRRSDAVPEIGTARRGDAMSKRGEG